MGELESIILDMLYKRQQISQIGKILKIEEEALADIIIDLDSDGLVMLQDKQWLVTKKGRDLFKKREEDLKKLKIEYLHGNINREEYDRRKKELDNLSQISSFQTNDTIETGTIIKPKIKDEHIKDEHIKDEHIKDEHIKEDHIKEDESVKNVICPKCGMENKPESNYCRKCGNTLKKV